MLRRLSASCFPDVAPPVGVAGGALETCGFSRAMDICSKKE